jgi:hypothetical protein
MMVLAQMEGKPIQFPPITESRILLCVSWLLNRAPVVRFVGKTYTDKYQTQTGDGFTKSGR